MSLVRNNIDRPKILLALLAFAQLIISIDYNIVYVALPEIGRELGFSAHTLQWVISAYAVAFGGFLLLGGRACDLFGPRRIFILGLAFYAASSLAGGLSASPGMLVASRAVQGIGGAFLFPATLTLVGVSFAAGAERNRAFAVWGTAGGSGMILGSLLGGVLTDAFRWPAVFYVNVPLAVAAIVLAFAVIPRDLPWKASRKFDLAGALSGTAGITLVVFAIVQGPESGWMRPANLGAAIAGVVALTAFLTIQRRSRDPLLPLHLMANRDLRTGVVVTFLYMGTFGTLLYFLTVYFQNVHGYSALRTGFAFLIPMIAIAVGAQTGGRLATRYGTRTSMVGSLLIGGIGAIVVALTMGSNASYLALVPGLVVLGLGQGAAYTLMFGAASTGVAAKEQGIASGLASTTQQIGGAVGLALLVTVANAATNDHGAEAAGDATTAGLRAAFLIATIGIAVSTLVATGFTAVHRRSSTPTQPANNEKQPVQVMTQ
ncbi:MFS transporter [Micromonospora sp. NBC_00362]|uniref:MFS transporter n=1 Tax=Micromonospora sp. NBC_00362 TaxID=2975975 RepID=UPI00225B958B|nr:MFS transporter [Micromonospora sp. NBC_00362]MCX5121741.1 MFS transporter [Micromonospora sp. NBC_00362]